MDPLNAREIYGNWATLLLPVHEDDSIDYARLEQEVALLIAAGVNGIYSNGTAGEFYSQTEEEFDRIHELLASMCNKAGMPFQIGCSHLHPAVSLERIRRARALKPGAIQVILPDWTAPSLPEVIRYLTVLCEAAAPIGLVLYNPPHAKKRLTPEEFGQLKGKGIHLVGCKVGHGDEHWYAAMKDLNGDLSLFVPGHYLATGIQQGAHGAYSNVACLSPGGAQQWYELMHSDLSAALEWERRIQQFLHQCIAPYIQYKGYSNQPADKLLAAVGGWSPVGTRLRWPYQGIAEEEIPDLRQAYCRLLPELEACNTLLKNEKTFSNVD